MTPDEFREALHQLDFAETSRSSDEGVSAFARWIGVARLTVQRWLAGGPPDHVARLLRLMIALDLSPRDVDRLTPPPPV